MKYIYIYILLFMLFKGLPIVSAVMLTIRTLIFPGTATAVSFAGVVGIAAGIWYLIKLRKKAPVACGVQSNENRLF